MCGIAGIVRWDGAPIAERDIRSMCSAIVHRGPDDEGVYLGNRVIVLRGSPSKDVRVLETNRAVSTQKYRMSDEFFTSCKSLREALIYDKG